MRGKVEVMEVVTGDGKVPWPGRGHRGPAAHVAMLYEWSQS